MDRRDPRVEGLDRATAGAGLVIGVSKYTDSRLSSCPAAARTAEAVAQALAPCLSNGVTTVIDPGQSYELFVTLQKTAEKARGGVFVLYFAGMTIRRGDNLLLTTCASMLEGKKGCIPWWDVDAILAQEKVANGIVILNAEGFAGVGWLGAKAANIYGMGSVRIHDPLTAEKRLGEYGDAVADAFRKSAHELRPHLTDGRLDVAALGRYLAERAPTPKDADPLRPKRGEPPRHETFGSPDPSPVVLRDLREELARPPPARAAALRAGGAGDPVTSPRPRTLALVVLIAVVAVVVVAIPVLYFVLRG